MIMFKKVFGSKPMAVKSCVSSCCRFLDLLSAKSFRGGGYWFVVLHMTNEIWIKIKRSRPGFGPDVLCILVA